MDAFQAQFWLAMHFLKFAIFLFLVIRMRTSTTTLACLPRIAECQKVHLADGKARPSNVDRTQISIFVCEPDCSDCNTSPLQSITCKDGPYLQDRP